MTIKCPKGQHEGFSKKLALSAILDNMNGLMWGWQCTCSENQTAAAFLALINTTMGEHTDKFAILDSLCISRTSEVKIFIL